MLRLALGPLVCIALVAGGQIEESGYTAGPPPPTVAPSGYGQPQPPPSTGYGQPMQQAGYGGGGGYVNDYKNRPLDNGYGMRKVEPATVNKGRQLTYQQWCAEQTEPCPSEQEFEEGGYGQSYGNSNDAPKAAPYGPAPAPAYGPAPAPAPSYEAPRPAPQPSYPAPAPAPSYPAPAATGYVNKLFNAKAQVQVSVQEELVKPLGPTPPPSSVEPSKNAPTAPLRAGPKTKTVLRTPASRLVVQAKGVQGRPQNRRRGRGRRAGKGKGRRFGKGRRRAGKGQRRNRLAPRRKNLKLARVGAVVITRKQVRNW